MPTSLSAPRPSAPYTNGCRGAVRDYSLFGGVLRSELEFPDLPAAPADAEPDWALVVTSCAPRADALAFLGSRRVGQESYTLWRTAVGWRLEYSHAGIFEVDAAGRSIVWYRRQDALMELVRSVAIGPALALALEAAGFLCLHGSAVSVESRAIAFVGPKHFGKSTLAMALTAAGAKLIGDDLLAITPGPPAMVRPGVASVRLWPDMAHALPLESVSTTLVPGVKNTVTGFLPDKLTREAMPLRAIYVLSPVPTGQDVRAGWRDALLPVEAAIAVAHQTKLPASLVGLRAAGAQLAAAASIAASVPVWKLHVIRDAARLPNLLQQIIQWSLEA